MQANCPICLEDIGAENCVLTECGHSFHTNCLMKNVAFNGFGCPYCRTAMAEEQEEYEEYEEYEEDDDYALRGFRFFNNLLNDDLHDLEDLVDELSDSDVALKPTTSEIVENLVDQGVTMEDFVKAMLSQVREYEDTEEEYSRIDNELFQKIRTVIIAYQAVNY